MRRNSKTRYSGIRAEAVAELSVQFEECVRMRERARIMRAEVVDTVEKCRAGAESAFLRFSQSLPRCQTAVFPLYGACVCYFPERTNQVTRAALVRANPALQLVKLS